MAVSADRLVQLLEASRYPVTYWPNWRTLNRQEWSGAYQPYAVGVHCTASEAQQGMIDYCRTGDKVRGMPAPFYHILVDKAEGRRHVIGWGGRAVHAVGCDPAISRLVKADAMPRDRQLVPTMSGSDARADKSIAGGCYAISGMYAFTPTPVQYESMVDLAALLCREEGWTGGSVLAHAEMTNGRADPRKPMGLFRGDVDDALAASTTRPPAVTPQPQPPMEDDVSRFGPESWDEADKQAFRALVVGTQGKGTPIKLGEALTAAYKLARDEAADTDPPTSAA